jgi:hypothetical protein
MTAFDQYLLPVFRLGKHVHVAYLFFEIQLDLMLRLSFTGLYDRSLMRDSRIAAGL